MDEPDDTPTKPTTSSEPHEPAPAPPYLQPAVVVLDDAHTHWHDAADAYHTPDDFRRHVEALVQALRNVTWRLQANQSELAHFDRWYPGWRDLMRADKLMKWLNEARVDIVKRSGLQSESLARVRVIDSYLEPGSVLLKLPVGTPTVNVVAEAQAAIPAIYRQYVAIEISRRWVVPERVDRELLSVLAHCFHVLDALLLYAREVAAGEFLPESPSEFLATVAKPTCMQVDPSLVPLTFKADTGDLFTYEQSIVTQDAELVQTTVARYGEPAVDGITRTEENALLEFGRMTHAIARQIFRIDGYLVPVVKLLKPDRHWDTIVPLANDKRDKFMMWHEIGKKVLVGGHDAFVATSEMWMAPMPETVRPYMEVSQLPGRGEAVATWFESADGTRVSWISEIGRLLNTSFLKETLEVRDADETPGFSEPIRRAWRLRSRSQGSRASSVDSDEPPGRP